MTYSLNRKIAKPSEFKVMTINNIKECIRDAIGQLLEYTHYDNEEKIAELVIMFR